MNIAFSPRANVPAKVAIGTLLMAAALFMEGCSPNDPGSTPTPTGPAATPTATVNPGSTGPSGPGKSLQSMSAGERIQMPLKPSETISDGYPIIRNVGSSKVSITAVDVISNQDNGKLRILGSLTRAIPAGSADLIGIQRVFPPQRDAQGATNAIGTIIDPFDVDKSDHEVVVGIGVTSGNVEISGLRITYMIDGRTYTQQFDQSLVLCLGRPANSTTCV
ncbi:hypothetical protein F4553_004783 [Allocatelliglobosispora scoriae]|uniref:Uncharacterized protein n=1 Tax=Allocatelliglobosispora scoriae TaxID=643052 RepID=A0A841BT68_9ACTN|nr:hypothetical protein [Allocatelliglobosispora scoriae]MBB5871404.1 hypothetical protein [Allocatelliglobosispora scoriae]